MASIAVREQIRELQDSLTHTRLERDKLAELYDEQIVELQAAKKRLREVDTLLKSLPAHRLWRLLSICIQQQKDGNDILASAYWDDVVKCWAELEKTT